MSKFLFKGKNSSDLLFFKLSFSQILTLKKEKWLSFYRKMVNGQSVKAIVLVFVRRFRLLNTNISDIKMINSIFEYNSKQKLFLSSGVFCFFFVFLIKKWFLFYLDQYYNIDVPSRTARVVTTRFGRTLSNIWYNCP